MSEEQKISTKLNAAPTIIKTCPACKNNRSKVLILNGIKFCKCMKCGYKTIVTGDNEYGL